MEYKIIPTGCLSGEVDAPGSKSYTIRAILAALLTDGKTTVRAPLQSRDTQAAYNACEAFGGKITRKKDHIIIKGTGGKIKAPKDVLDTLNSGTTIRIATAIAALSDCETTLTGDESIRRRPIKALLDALNQLGTTSSSASGCPPVKIKGPLTGGVCEIPGDISSQYITAILMASPYAKKDVEIKLKTRLKSRPYVDLTLDMLKRHKISVENRGYESFHIACRQKYKPTDYTVEGDYSSAAFILSAAALTKSHVRVNNLFNDSLQADKKIVETLSKMGANAKTYKDHVVIESDGTLNGLTVDLSDSPDLLPIVSVLGAFAEGKTEIVNTGHARLKECDRIHAMAVELKKMGADIVEKQDGLIMKKSKLLGTTVDGWCDHRIIMSLAVAGMHSQGTTKITGAEHVDVTFPNFRELMNGLGAEIK
ncbi:MAG: 3-phosphoshikimate 1-carboxyvinyltransferase [Candidatus Altiarchaeota archaeon]|nr:3-phosphoshikimate 1-carboxyvinyltransferase [Candidatus Altiarchaeota archaeon]